MKGAPLLPQAGEGSDFAPVFRFRPLETSMSIPNDPGSGLASGPTVPQLEAIGVSADHVSTLIMRGFADATASSKAFDKSLQDVLGSFEKMARKAVGGVLKGGVSSLLEVALQGIGGIAGGEGVQAFADGGVVSRPTYFGSASGPGLMGERGAEAI